MRTTTVGTPKGLQSSWNPAKMIIMNRLRWDIRVGLAATALAIAGFVSSIFVGNEEAFGSSRIDAAHQKTLLVFTVAIGALTLAKWWQSRRQG